MKLYRLLIVAIFLIVVIVSGSQAAFLCGDANGDTRINLIDVSYMINTLYRGGSPSNPPAAADLDNSTRLNLIDVSYLISFLYRGGLVPVCPSDSASGGIIDASACKSNFTEMAIAQASSSDCIVYNYDGTGVLDIRHVDALLNCGPWYWGEVVVKGDTIEIAECWTGRYRCTCTFDLDFRISNLSPGSYHIIFNLDYYNYLYQTHDIRPNFETDIDLIGNPSDSFCVP
jgi:hypothetical protein